MVTTTAYGTWERNMSSSKEIWYLTTKFNWQPNMVSIIDTVSHSCDMLHMTKYQLAMSFFYLKLMGIWKIATHHCLKLNKACTRPHTHITASYFQPRTPIYTWSSCNPHETSIFCLSSHPTAMTKLWPERQFIILAELRLQNVAWVICGWVCQTDCWCLRVFYTELFENRYTNRWVCRSVQRRAQDLKVEGAW